MTNSEEAQNQLSESSGAHRDDAAMRRRLPCTWHAFFARFPSLRPIQVASIPTILRGDNAIVNAPTASGKTEAIMAPLLERIIRHRQKTKAEVAKRAHSTTLQNMQSLQNMQNNASKAKENAKTWFDAMADSKSSNFYSGSYQPKNELQRRAEWRAEEAVLSSQISVLLVAPTKALCNDLHRRLVHPIQGAGLSVAIRTGDNPTINLSKLPDVLVTTPESFDSIMSRKPSILRTVLAVVVDEIHLLAGSGRGDHLQCLLERLKLISHEPLQICASSATVPEIERIANDFLGSGAKIISTEASRRQIEATVEMVEMGLGAESTAARLIGDIVEQSPTNKVLAFCNSRRNVEYLTYALRQNPRLAPKVFAHHGSLSRDERLRTEQQFLRARNAVCIATSTLELGIDIGDVDRIVLLGPPPDVSSLIQRIGRGCRHQSVVNATCLADCEFNAHRFLHLVSCARDEMLFPDPVAIRPTVVVQQALSICLQNPKKWVGKQALYERLSPATREMYSLEECECILNSMASSSLLRKVEKGRYVPEARAQFLFDRGYMHSLIEERSETDVVDSMTGRTLGSVRLRSTEREALSRGGDVSLTIAGASHAVSRIRDEKIFVTQSSDASKADFLALEPPRYSLGLAQDFAKYMHIPNDAIYVRCVARGSSEYKSFTPESGDLLKTDVPKAAVGMLVSYQVHHFLGTVGSLLLKCYFRDEGTMTDPHVVTPFFMHLTSRPKTLVLPDANVLSMLFERYIRNEVGEFAKVLQPGPWLGMIPENIVIKWIMKSIRIRDYAELLADKGIVIL